ncbi:MAG: acyltransferase [Cyanobacteria bacterium P01_G01_bin.19]
MNIQQPTGFVLWWLHCKTKIITTLLGWIPLLPGLAVRYLLYPTIFSKMGRSVKVYPDVRLRNSHRIEIGFGVVLNRGVEIGIDTEDRVEFGERVCLFRDVQINSTGKGNNIKLGNSVCLDSGVIIRTHDGGQVEIGEHTYIGPYSSLVGHGKIEIGKDCRIASHCSICAHNYNFNETATAIRKQGINFKGITIEDDCWLGSGVRVVDGVTIAQGSVIGTGAVVTKDIPPYSIAVGVPAKVVSKRDKRPDNS